MDQLIYNKELSISHFKNTMDKQGLKMKALAKKSKIVQPFDKIDTQIKSDINKLIEQEQLNTKENFIVEHISDKKKLVDLTTIEKIDDYEDRKKSIAIIENHVKMSTTPNVIQNDIKTNNNININSNMDNIETIQNTEMPTEEDATVVVPKFKPLSIDMINASLKVVSDLPAGKKLRVIDDVRLAVEDRWVPSLARLSISGQYNRDSRHYITYFLDHLFTCTEQTINSVLANIRNGVNQDTNVAVFQGLVSKLHTFLHRYEIMRNVYVDDSDIYSRLGVIRDKFRVFDATLFRNLTISNK